MSALLTSAVKASTGRLQINDDTDTPDNISSGIPYESDGKVAVDLNGDVDHHSMGLPFTAEGRLAVTISTVTSYGGGATPLAGGKLSLEDAAPANYSAGVGYTAGGELSAVGLP